MKKHCTRCGADLDDYELATVHIDKEHGIKCGGKLEETFEDEEDDESFDTDRQFDTKPYGDKCDNVPKWFPNTDQDREFDY